MKERPTLFSTPMVQAILAGRKTQTRRIRTNAQAGDLLWVKETFFVVVEDPCKREVKWIYKADMKGDINDNPFGYKIKWKPSIFMPREACRLFLRVLDVRTEQAHALTEADAKAEGVEKDGSYRFAFSRLWDTLNEKRGYGWDTNPIVKVITFDLAHPHSASSLNDGGISDA